MRKLILLLAGTAAAVVLLVGLRQQDKAGVPRPAALSPSGSSTSATASPPPPSYRDGRVVGPAVRTDYGVVQVAAVVRNGRLVEVSAVRIPDRDPMDVRLSRPAVRQLGTAAVEAQSATIDVVSGATYTSVGYLKSLQSALDQLSS